MGKRVTVNNAREFVKLIVSAIREITTITVYSDYHFVIFKKRHNSKDLIVTLHKVGQSEKDSSATLSKEDVYSLAVYGEMLDIEYDFSFTKVEFPLVIKSRDLPLERVVIIRKLYDYETKE
jgi:hypothetical protein